MADVTRGGTGVRESGLGLDLKAMDILFKKYGKENGSWGRHEKNLLRDEIPVELFPDVPDVLDDLGLTKQRKDMTEAQNKMIQLKNEIAIRLEKGDLFPEIDRSGSSPFDYTSEQNKISDADIVDGARDFRLMKRSMVDAIVSMSEYNRFSKGIFGWIGFRTCWLPYKNIERVAGETKWNFWKLFKYAVSGIINFSQVPLTIASWFGTTMTGFSFLVLVAIIVRKLIFDDPVPGWASTICVIIFIGGLQLFCLGIMGQYIAKTYMEVKQRPHYIIAESNKKDFTPIR